MNLLPKDNVDILHKFTYYINRRENISDPICPSGAFRSITWEDFITQFIGYCNDIMVHI